MNPQENPQNNNGPQPMPIPQQPGMPDHNAPINSGAPAIPGQPVTPAQPGQNAQYNNQQPVAQPQTDTLGIVSVILAVVGMTLPGLIVGIVGLNKAKKAGISNTWSKIGTILNAVFMVLGTLVFIGLIVASFNGAQDVSMDLEGKTNLNSAYVKLEEHYNDNGYYPESLDSLSSYGLDSAVITVFQNEAYSYEPVQCNQSKCQKYIVSFDTIRDGIYEKESLN